MPETITAVNLARQLTEARADSRELKQRNAELLAALITLNALAPRLRLRSPATSMEIQVWAKLREEARAAIAKVKGE